MVLGQLYDSKITYIYNKNIIIKLYNGQTINHAKNNANMFISDIIISSKMI